MVDQSKSNLVIVGTSSVHDWESECKKVSGKANFEMEGNEIKSLSSASISLKVDDIESGKSLMDSKTHDAFKADKFPSIKGTIANATLSKKGEDFLLSGMGTLEMAGIKKTVSLNATCKVSSSSITCSGSHKIDMTEFDMKPPTAMMGTIKVGKDVEVKMNLVFKR